VLVECRIGGAPALRPKLRVERQPFLAPEDVIFGVDFPGPQILVVKLRALRLGDTVNVSP
jgi:hypothetical protein